MYEDLSANLISQSCVCFVLVKDMEVPVGELANIKYIRTQGTIPEPDYMGELLRNYLAVKVASGLISCWVLPPLAANPTGPTNNKLSIRTHLSTIKKPGKISEAEWAILSISTSHN